MAQPQPQASQVPPQMMQVPHLPQVSQMAQRQSYSSPQHSPSPSSTPQPGYVMPPNKRPRTGPSSPPQPRSPYAATPYAAGPQATAASPVATASPNYSGLAAPAAPQPYNTPYTNGNSAPSPAPTPTLYLPEPRPQYPASPAPQAAQAAPMPPSSQYTTATMAPIAPPPPPQTPGTMPPPSKPAERPTKEIDYDVTDSLAGTGIDLRAEEQFMAEFYAGSFAQEARTGAPANTPGSRSSFYGAGFANQPGELAGGLSQEAYEASAAQRAWEEAAHRLAVVRSNEIINPFLIIPNLHHRVDKIAKEHGIGLNLELKNPNQMGKMRAPQEFPQPKVTVSTQLGPDGAMVMTTGSFIPHDAYLVDQLALLSIATKHRLRELIEDANSVAVIRQTTSHGEIPAEWADVAVPLKTGLDSLPELDGPESTANANPLKRSFDAFASQAPSKSGKHGPKNLAEAVREAARADRDVEEARLRKRQKRSNPEPTAQAGSRAGSVAAGTPGSAAPEAETKAPSKRELKKGAAAARLAEASSTASANQTLSTLMGGFGRRKKEYSWLQKPGSGASTPRSSGQDSAPSAAGGGAKAPEKTMLTSDPRYPRLGTWREDKEKGKNIQLRDWVVALELDGIEIKALQAAYVKLDSSTPKDRS
ncbi:hypothetical protein VTK56DRAFT_9843 [Thermocarpiscus australiensis]